MNVASKELCEELYELSRWEDTDYAHAVYIAPTDPPSAPRPAIVHQRELKWDYTHIRPAYDLGYLWKKAEDMTGNEFAVGYNDSGCFYHFKWGNRGAGNMIEGIGESFSSDAETIEDSFCEWMIFLLKRNIS